jgi:glycosyltransferase involved in cell wall biosynthesis/SAM-dependent methyltransferase
MVSDVSPLVMAGGAERVLWEQASRLGKRGSRVRVVSRHPERAAAETVEREGVHIRHYAVDRRSSLRFLLGSIVEARRAVTLALAEETSDVLQLYQPLSGYGALRSDRARSLPCLYTFLSPAPLEYASREGMTGQHQHGLIGRVAQLTLWAIERACLRRASRIHVLSDFSASQIWKLYRITSDRIVKIPGGVDTGRFQPAADRERVRRSLGVPAGSTVLLTVRNLEARMGLDSLIRAMDRLRQRIPEVALLIGGAGSLRGYLESLTDSLGLGEHVRFLGYIAESDLPRYYQAADVYVLPTQELEGFGLTTVESLASGTPVLGTRVGATPEILLPLDPSLLFQAGTPEAMAQDLARLLETTLRDPSASQLLRQACRRHAETCYSWDHSVAHLEETLARLARGWRELSAAQPCPACGDLIRAPDLAYLGTRYLRCPRCGTGAVRRLPTPASLRRQYEVGYPLRFPQDHVPEPRGEMFASILDRLEALGAGGRLLDVGCGGGQLLASAARRGWRGLGADLSHRTCVLARRAGMPVVQADATALPFRDAGMDGVSLVNVLDHTPDPSTALFEVRRVLRPGGHLAIRIPNAAFHRPCIRLLAALGPLSRWRGWDRVPILHLFALTPRGVRLLVQRAGFEVLDLRNSSLAAEGFARVPGASRRTRLGWLHGCVAAGAGAVRILTQGRLLVGPSIELYARRPAHGGGGAP